MKIKHVLASKKDKKATIQSGEMKKILGVEELEKVALWYPELECVIVYHQSRNGSSWYANTSFPKSKQLPSVGLPIDYEVNLIQSYEAYGSPLTFDFNYAQPKQLTMELDGEFQAIRDWAHERGIYEKGDVKTQYLKLLEEVGELSKAILTKDKDEVIDAIGDCVVVLTNLTELASNNFRTNCKSCRGMGALLHNVAGDGGQHQWLPCEDCYGFTIEDCINSAYEVIAKRKGTMVNGTFVKSEK
jgi:NTP pyrophosphatase (non-canonical NTP hydrolase)